jgi:hypothetical protein
MYVVKVNKTPLLAETLVSVFVLYGSVAPVYTCQNVCNVGSNKDPLFLLKYSFPRVIEYNSTSRFLTHQTCFKKKYFFGMYKTGFSSIIWKNFFFIPKRFSCIH